MMTKKNEEELMEEEQEVVVEEQPRSAKASLEVTDIPGVGAATAEKLSLSGFGDVMSIAVATPGELVNASGVSEVVARKMIRAARDMLDMGFQSGIDLLKKRESVLKIKTGSDAFDAMTR
jgi:DNA repair protein RadA